MKDSSRADARVYRYHRAPRPREFISGPPRFASPTARNLSSCEITATRKSSSIISHGDIHHQMVITGGSRVIPDLFADPVITTRNVTRRGSFIPPSPSPQKAEGNLSASIFTTRNLSVPISTTTRNLLVLIFRREGRGR